MCPGFYVMCDSEHFGVVHSDLTKHELVHIYSWFWRKVIVSATRSIALLVGCQLPQIRAHSNLILVFRSSGSAPSQQSVQSTSAVVILVHRQTSTAVRVLHDGAFIFARSFSMSISRTRRKQPAHFTLEMQLCLLSHFSASLLHLFCSVFSVCVVGYIVFRIVFCWLIVLYRLDLFYILNLYAITLLNNYYT